MRILTLTYEFPPLGGGGAKVADGLASHLAARGHRLDILTMGYGDLSPYEERDRTRIFRVSRFRRKIDRCGITEMLPHEARVMRVGKKMISEKQYDIVHCHFMFPDGIVGQYLAKKAGIPVMTTIHGSDIPGYNPDRFQFLHSLLTPAWRYAVSHTDLITSPSEHLQNLLLKSASSAKSCIIPNGFDPRRYSASRSKKHQILVCTRMFKRKGVQYVLEAVAQLDTKVPVHIVGDGPYLPELKDLASQLAIDATFWGWLDNDSPELRELYETSKIFAFTSDQENFPINLLEAMCAGNAIITTNSSGTQEVVGDAAILVPPQDPTAIATAIRRLDDEALSVDLSQRAKRRICENFSWDIVAERFEETMLDLIDSHRRR